MNYKGIIFDIDGTLIYTRPSYWRRIIKATLKRMNKSTTVEKMDYLWFGNNRNEIIEKEFDVNPTEFWDIFREYATPKARRKNIYLYEDVNHLKTLHRIGLKLGIVTSTPKNIVDMEMTIIDSSLFESIVVAHSSNNISPKPDTEGVLLCLNEMGLTNEDVIFVGNGDEDIMTAKRVNMLDILIDRNEYKNTVNSSKVIYSLYELDEILGIQNSNRQ